MKHYENVNMNVYDGDAHIILCNGKMRGLTVTGDPLDDDDGFAGT